MINLIYTILCIVSICIGFFYGYKLGKNEEIEKPTERIKEIVENHKEKKQEKRNAEQERKEVEKLNNILQNIDSYDGTNRNQREV